MPLYRATTSLLGEPAARVLRDALDTLDPPPLASEIHDHDDASGLWDVGGLFDGPPDAAGLALLARAARRPGLLGDAGRGSRLGGAGAGGADAGGGGPLRRLRQPRPRPDPGKPDRPGDRGGAGLRHRAPRHDPGMPDRARPAGPPRLRRPAGRGHRRRHRRPGDGGGRGSGRQVRSPATSTRWRPGPPAPTSPPTASRRASAASPRLASATLGSAPARRYDLIFANILAGPLRRLAPDLARHQAPGGVRDPVGHPRAAVGRRCRRLPRLGLRLA